MVCPRRTAFLLASVLLGCATAGGPQAYNPAVVADRADSTTTLAQIYFWRAKPGKLEEYTRYIREHAEPIDNEARRAGAFLSVTTYMASDTTVPWTHARFHAARLDAAPRAWRCTDGCRRSPATGQREAKRADRVLREPAGPRRIDRRATRQVKR